jgi:hypothetical protein
VIGFISYLYLPFSPTRTKGPLWRRGWYTEREEVIMVNRILRDDPAKGITALKEPATFRDIINTWKDKSMWGLYFIGGAADHPDACARVQQQPFHGAHVALHYWRVLVSAVAGCFAHSAGWRTRVGPFHHYDDDFWL